MRFLKQKISLASRAQVYKSFTQQLVCEEEKLTQDIKHTDEKQMTAIPKSPTAKSVKKTKKDDTDALKCTKNIVINFGRAMTSFACSEIAVPYLKQYTQNAGIALGKFIEFIAKARETIGNIASLRSLLLVNNKDDENEKACKAVFKSICEVFLKYFSVNWIINGKVTHKMTYLKYRFKMLRRVQNPEYFTYVRSSKSKN